MKVVVECGRCGAASMSSDARSSATRSITLQWYGSFLASFGALANSRRTTSSCFRRARNSTAVFGGTDKFNQPSTVTIDSRCFTSTFPLLQNIMIAIGLTALVSMSVGLWWRCCASLWPPVFLFSKRIEPCLKKTGLRGPTFSKSGSIFFERSVAHHLSAFVRFS